jgi:Na+/melibiose symporter-like transporter
VFIRHLDIEFGIGHNYQCMNSSNVRLAVFFALRNSLGIFVTTILLMPVVAVVHRMFDGNWYVNWRLMLSVSGILTSLFFAFWLVTQLLEVSAEETRERQCASSSQGLCGCAACL